MDQNQEIIEALRKVVSETTAGANWFRYRDDARDHQPTYIRLDQIAEVRFSREFNMKIDFRLIGHEGWRNAWGADALRLATRLNLIEKGQ